MDKLEALRTVVDEILRNQSDKEQSRCGFVHLYGVATLSSLLAVKRGLNAHLSATAGMLHDISSYRTGDSADHARRSSMEARSIMSALGCFTQEEISIVCKAILNHSNKDQIHDTYDEVLKDADVLQHYLYNTSLAVIEKEKKRLVNVLAECDIVLQL